MIEKYVGQPQTVFYIKEMSYLKYGSLIANQGCGKLDYTPDFYPGTLANGLVSRPVDDGEFKSVDGLKFVIETPLSD